jgi:hypothetical protein
MDERSTIVKLKTLLASAAIAALFATAAYADYKSVPSGNWRTYEAKSNTNTQPMCGMETRWNAGMAFFVKYFQGADTVTFQIMKTSWRFPKEGVEIPMTIGVDKNPILEGKAIAGYMSGNLPIVEFSIRMSDQWPKFVEDFGEANQLWLRFETGNEPPWSMDMSGSRNAVAMMKSCIASINATYTRPYGHSSTQPYGNPGTQPVQPSQPPPRQPAAKKDSGSI